MYELPQISTSGFDPKGVQALEALTKLQKEVLQSDSQRDFKPSQVEIAKISSIIFRARVNNQSQLNQWFLESVNSMVNQVTEVFNSNHCDDTKSTCLLSDCLNCLNIVIKFIFFSAVFIIDAKESNRLFTLGVQTLKQKLIQPIIPKLISQIINTTRSLDIDCSMELIHSKLYEAKLVLETIRACGWQDLTIVKEKDGKLVFKKWEQQSQKNQLFNESFEKPYIELLRSIISQLPHKSPLTPLTNQIDHEHKILSILAPYSEQNIMEQIEAESISKVVKELEISLIQMIDQGHNEEVLGVVQLFKKVAGGQPIDTCVEFEIGNQYIRKQENQTDLPVKPFKILAVMLRKYFIDHQPQSLDVQSIIVYVKKYKSYIHKIFDNQKDIDLALNEAIEVILNNSQNISESILSHLQNDQDETLIQDILHIIPYLHQPKLVSTYGQRILSNLLQSISPFKSSSVHHDIKILLQLKSLLIEQSIEWYKVSEIIKLCQQFKVSIDKDQKIYLTIPTFCENDFEAIKVSSLPKSLREKLGQEELLILDYGYSIIQFNSNKLVLSTSQTLLVLILDSRNTTNLSDLEDTYGKNSKQLCDSLSTLKDSGLLSDQDGQIKLNYNWQPENGKNTAVFIDQ